MPHTFKRFVRTYLFLSVCIGMLLAIPAHASVSGSISGTVKDPAGKVLPGATIDLREEDTGQAYKTVADPNGHFTLPVLPVGKYDMTVGANGFESFESKDINLSNNSALNFDVALSVGSVTQTVSVSDNSLHVETSNSQMGEVISSRQMAAIPLNGRSFTDLLSMQPGVAPQTAITSTSVQDVGATQLAPSGTLNPGTISVNGQPEGSNVFIVNGSNAEEDVTSSAAVVPNLDSIAEFRIITNNFDAEYGQYSGGQIHVITKSGTNAFHGNVFEFFRNTNLDARNYFSPTRGSFLQNQFGGTFGGPIRPEKVFFFVDYQGTKQTQGIDTGEIGVPSNANRTGDLSDQVDANGVTLLRGTVGGPYFASLLTQRLGYAVGQAEPYYFTKGGANPAGGVYATDCTSTAQCVFPNAFIPKSAWSLPGQKLLQYIPAPNVPDGTFATSAFNQTVRDDKEAIHLDGNSRFGNFSAYYYIDDFNLDNPYPVGQSGASVPGFNALTTGRAQLVALGHTKIFNASTVNEVHLTFVRDYTDVGDPVGGRNVSLVSQGFVNPDGSSSIVPLDPKGQSVENVLFNSYSIGAAANELKQANNSYGFTETFTKILGSHTVKVGAVSYEDQVNVAPVAQFNGTFSFSGTETGVDFADFLIGVPTQFNQSQLNPFYARNLYGGLFAQDSWHARSNLTVNYGLRWDLIAPWTEKYNQISAFVPGEQSVVFPEAPTGIVYPGDPGIPNTLAKTRKLSFSPRVGFVWSPHASDGFLATLLGGAGTTSIRAGFGTFYTSIEALSISILAANPPYGTTYASPAPPLFGQPFVNASDGQNFGQPFPYQFANEHASASHPDTSLNWTFNPISGIPGFDVHNRVPFTQEYMLSIERQAGPNTILSASYVGTSSHREEVLIENNPGNPALCLSLSQPNEVAPGTATCGP
ncbi:MAG TPA: carboxypeptidase-like regulatory domain-containing protein, partial [Acidisarcina sp.]